MRMTTAVGVGACLGDTKWLDSHEQLAQVLATTLHSSPYRLRFQSITPDFIFSIGGVSVAFIVLTDWKVDDFQTTFERSAKMGKTFKNCYTLLTVSSAEENKQFLDAFFRSNANLLLMGKPAFILVENGSMALERMFSLAHAHAECKRQGIMKLFEDERICIVQSSEAIVAAVSSIPGLDSHAANTLLQGVGSIEDISRASKEDILEKTDLSPEKAELVEKFFRDAQYYMASKHL